jgi:large subunit ribosomal protein L17
MAHAISRRKLGRPTDQRLAILRSLVTSLVWHGKIVTTEARAKEARSVAEKLITLARTDTVANRRNARRVLYPVGLKYSGTKTDGTTLTINRPTKDRSGSVETAIARLFNDVGPQYKERDGGYVRLVRLGAVPPREHSDRALLASRRGDGATMVMMELVDYVPPVEVAATPKTTRKSAS